MSRRVLLLRHGRTAWNAERRFQGQANPPLDDVGRAQAYEVAALVAALQPSVIVSSDLLRATQTAIPLGEVTGLEVRVDPRLRERSLGHWEGLTRDDVERLYPDEFADWVAGRDVSRRGGESREELAKRALDAFNELPDVEVAVVVTHSATAMALSASLIGLSQNIRALGPLANCHWSELQRESPDEQRGFWRLRAHNAGAPGPIVPIAAPSGPGGYGQDRYAQDDDVPDAQA